MNDWSMVLVFVWVYVTVIIAVISTIIIAVTIVTDRLVNGEKT